MKKIILGLCLILGINSLYAKGDLYIFDIENKEGKYTPKLIEKAFENNGYYISANSEMNQPFMIQFKETSFKVFTLLTIFHEELSEKLVLKHPKAGIFVPAGVGIYQSKDDDFLHVSILTAEAQEKIVGFKDSLFHQIEKKNLETLKKALPGAKMHLSEQAMNPTGPLVTSFEVETDEDWEEMKEELAMVIEDGFKPFGFVMSNYTEYNYMLSKEETIDTPFDFYDTYSICKLKVIYTVSKTRPEAAAFAPCTMIFYKKKGEDKIVMGFPAVYNWMSSAHVTDDKAKAALMKAQKDFETILREATE
ncbi:MAG: DUF302 domain-containing protein [Arcobacter sp.]|nr:MAG: DUF302 domain-containing protein [Arcobacter sp.]